jgi:predicted nuclease of predicted toxin-antitoxin system
VRLLVDNALSPTLASTLSSMGHDAIHVRDVDLAHASDVRIFAFAAEQDRVVLSADTDFGTLLALRGERSPSVVLWRRQSPRRAAEQAAVLLGVLATVEADLREGAIVVVEAARLRVRRLPIGGE